jgi:hypothetical protein
MVRHCMAVAFDALSPTGPRFIAFGSTDFTSLKSIPAEALGNFSRMGQVLHTTFGQVVRNSVRMIRWLDVQHEGHVR